MIYIHEYMSICDDIHIPKYEIRIYAQVCIYIYILSCMYIYISYIYIVCVYMFIQRNVG